MVDSYMNKQKTHRYDETDVLLDGEKPTYGKSFLEEILRGSSRSQLRYPLRVVRKSGRKPRRRPT